MQRRTKLLATGAVVLAVAATGTGISVAADQDDQPLTGANHDSAVAAALAHTGGGTVTETEVGDDGAAFEVEVRLEDGREVEVQLDASFSVIGQEDDDDSGEADDTDRED